MSDEQLPDEHWLETWHKYATIMLKLAAERREWLKLSMKLNAPAPDNHPELTDDQVERELTKIAVTKFLDKLPEAKRQQIIDIVGEESLP